MKNTELIEIKKEYDRLVKLRDKYNIIKNRMLELEEIKEVKEYIELSKQYNNAREYNDMSFGRESNEELAYRSVCCNNITPTTNIYCYIGTYKKNEDGDFEEIEKFSKEMDFAYFKNIESFEKNGVMIKLDKLSDFLDKNIIIYRPYGIDGSILFDEARRLFFETAILESQEKAVEDCKKYSKVGFPLIEY